MVLRVEMSEQERLARKKKIRSGHRASSTCVVRVVDGHWVFGGIERGREECFLVEVEKRDVATLLLLVSQHVRPGSIVLSDEWNS